MSFMSNLRSTSRLYRLLANDVTGASSRPTAAPAPCYFLAANGISQSAKEREAAQAVKEGAEEVKKTAKVIRDATQSTAKTINKMTKVVSEKVTECAEAFKGKAADSIVKATTDIIKDKVAGK
ncbi:hypothetical protein MLD38_020733 [Melastoma candidum]|uniref:Uncharacterized protein n=1 Tax=Melastoma candidum TaxID=119954 RepID=A0ACB9QE00_9MYRT|nr:hypothetical protein MLD38_020733 [Melastoma candidum]